MMAAHSVLWSRSIQHQKSNEVKAPRDRRTLSASLVSYADTIFSLLWPNKFFFFFAVFGESSPIQNNGKHFVGLYVPRTVYGPQPQKGGKSKTTVLVYLNKQFLMDVLSSA